MTLQLPKVRIAQDRMQIIDRHGNDVTNLFMTQSIYFGVRKPTGVLTDCRITIFNIGGIWKIKCPEGMSNRTTMVRECGYDLVECLEPNTVKVSYESGTYEQIEITFDCEWLS